MKKKCLLSVLTVLTCCSHFSYSAKKEKKQIDKKKLSSTALAKKSKSGIAAHKKWRLYYKECDTNIGMNPYVLEEELKKNHKSLPTYQKLISTYVMTTRFPNFSEKRREEYLQCLNNLESRIQKFAEKKDTTNLERLAIYVKDQLNKIDSPEIDLGNNPNQIGRKEHCTDNALALIQQDLKNAYKKSENLALQGDITTLQQQIKEKKKVIQLLETEKTLLNNNLENNSLIETNLKNNNEELKKLEETLNKKSSNLQDINHRHESLDNLLEIIQFKRNKQLKAIKEYKQNTEKELKKLKEEEIAIKEELDFQQRTLPSSSPQIKDQKNKLNGITKNIQTKLANLNELTIYEKYAKGTISSAERVNRTLRNSAAKAYSTLGSFFGLKSEK